MQYKNSKRKKNLIFLYIFKNFCWILSCDWISNTKGDKIGGVADAGAIIEKITQTMVKSFEVIQLSSNSRAAPVVSSTLGWFNAGCGAQITLQENTTLLLADAMTHEKNLWSGLTYCSLLVEEAWQSLPRILMSCGGLIKLFISYTIWLLGENQLWQRDLLWFDRFSTKDATQEKSAFRWRQWAEQWLPAGPY